VLSDYVRRRATLATGIGQTTLKSVHESLRPAATIFEHNTRALAQATDRILRKHGKNIIGKQFASRRLANIMIDLFVLGSVLSRVDASVRRAGMTAAARELEIVNTLARQVDWRVRDNLARIDDNEDEAIKSLADHAFEHHRFTWDNL
jgi:acyl-CoA dehydrogenase family protein 9